MRFWKSWRNPARSISKIIYVSKQNDISEHMRFCNYTPLIYSRRAFKVLLFFLVRFLIFDKFLGTKNTPEGVLIIDVLFT